jgi:hypothetical protein
MAQVVKCLPSKYKETSSNPNGRKEGEGGRKRGRAREMSLMNHNHDEAGLFRLHLDNFRRFASNSNNSNYPEMEVATIIKESVQAEAI